MTHKSLDDNLLETTIFTNKKVLFILNSLVDYVAYRLPLATRLVNEGCIVYILAPMDDPAAVNVIRASKNMFYFKLSLARRKYNPFSLIVPLIEIKKIINKIEPQLILCYRAQTIIISSPVFMFCKKAKIVCSFTGLGSIFIGSRIFKKIIRTLVIYALRITLKSKNIFITFQNEDDRTYFLQNKITTSMQSATVRGVDAIINFDIFKLKDFIPKDSVQILFVGRLLPDKGILELIEAIKIIRNVHPKLNFSCRVIGQIEKNADLITEKLVNGWVCDGIIEWIPAVDFNQMVEFYIESDIMCLPSYREGLPRCLLEAAAVGRPMVATDVPGCRDIVHDGVNGHLVAARDAEKLADALRKLIVDANLRSIMGMNARELVLVEFSREKIFKEQIDLYANLLGQ